MEEGLAGWATEFVLYTFAGLLFGAIELWKPARTKYRTDRVWDTAAYAAAELWVRLIGFFVIPTLYILGVTDFGIGLLPVLPVPVAVIMMILMLDFQTYWTHRLLHWRGMWRAHRWHHAPRHLTWFSGNRTTLGNEILLFTIPIWITLAVMGPVETGPPGSGFWWMVYSTAVYYVHNHFIHSNTRLGHRWLELVFVTPRVHRVHHASSWDYSNTNFGSLLTIWDRMFGTFRSPETIEDDFELGEPIEGKDRWRAFFGF